MSIKKHPLRGCFFTNMLKRGEVLVKLITSKSVMKKGIINLPINKYLLGRRADNWNYQLTYYERFYILSHLRRFYIKVK